MTKSRITSVLIPLTLAAAIAAAATPALAEYKQHKGFIADSFSFGTEQAGDLPAPPKLSAPHAEAHRSRPPMVTTTWGGMPRFRGPAAPKGVKSLKSK